MIYNETKYNTHWNNKKLEQLGEFSRGKSKHRPRNDQKLFENGKYPLIQTGEIKAANLMINRHTQEYSEFGLKQSKLWDAGTLCITIAANIAETGILEYPMCFPDSVVGFNADKRESSELFMHYVFSYIRNAIQNSVNGSIQDNINIGYLQNLDFKVPDRSYQDKIAFVLSLLDKKIENNTKLIKELEKTAKTIYDYWFLQYDFPNENGKPYKSSGGEMVWNQKLMKMIPQNWESATLSTFIQDEKGGDWGNDIKTSDHPVEVKCIRGADFNGLLGKEVLRSPTRYITQKNTSKFLEDGDIIVEISGGSPTQSTGRISYINEELLSRFEMPIITSNFCKAFSLKSKQYQYWFYISWEKLYDSGLFFNFESKTTGIKNLLFDIVCSSYNVIYPGKDIIKKYNTTVSPYFTTIQKKNHENKELINLRDWLLPMLMTGQVTVI